MNFKYRLINKLKNLLYSLNVIENDSLVHNSVKINGSRLLGKVIIDKNNIIKSNDFVGDIQINKNGYIENTKLKGTISIGKNSRIFETHLSGNIEIGCFTSLWGPNLDLHTNNTTKIKIGNFCSIARNVSIQTFNHNSNKITSYFIGQNFFKENWQNETSSKGNVLINNDVWIGTQSIILGGVTIGNGAIIAANSVVTNDVMPYTIVAGSPAKVIGYRFSDEIIQKLQKLEWWNWENEKIKNNKFLFEKELQIEDFDTIIL